MHQNFPTHFNLSADPGTPAVFNGSPRLPGNRKPALELLRDEAKFIPILRRASSARLDA